MADQAGTFEDFYRAQFPAARRYAARLFGPTHAEDIAQEAMVRALRHFPTLRAGGPVWPWVATVVRNAGVDRWRRERCVAVEQDILEVLLEPAPEPQPQPTPDERVHLLGRALGLLPTGQRRVLVLHAVCGLGIAEIAARTGTTANSIRQRLYRARRNLARHRVGDLLNLDGATVA